MDVRMGVRVVKGGVPMELVRGNLQALGQLRLLPQEQSPPGVRVVIAETLRVLPAQGVDEGPDIPLMGLQLLHRRAQGNGVRTAE